MTNLSVVLEKKADILALVGGFGFLTGEVRILIEQPFRANSIPPTLTLLVKCTPGSKEVLKAPSWLGAKLAEILNCEVNVTVFGRVKPLYKSYVIEKSTSIEDEAAMCKLFAVTSLDSVTLKDIDMEFYPSILKYANQYLASSMSAEKKPSDAENLSKYAVVCEAEAEAKKRKVGSSDEADSPNQGNTESPQKSNTLGSTKL